MQRGRRFMVAVVAGSAVLPMAVAAAAPAAPEPLQLALASTLSLPADAEPAAPRLALGWVAPATTGLRAGADLGLQWRVPLPVRIDLTGWWRLQPSTATATPVHLLLREREPQYGARMEMRLAAARWPAFGADARMLGLQLDSGARIGLRRSNGGVTLYYRAQF